MQLPPLPNTSASTPALPSGETLGPVGPQSLFADPDFYIWGATMTRTGHGGDGGACHLLYARWPRALGHDAWVTDSEIAHATADQPLGPYRHRSVVLPARGDAYWDGRCTHNPTVLAAGGRFYLYYMGTRGTASTEPGLNWSHRNQQRIGVAVADHPAGPWRRFDTPLVTGPEGTVCCANPTVTARPCGGFLMIYKAVRPDGDAPFYGPVVHHAATADHPEGPFTTLPGTVFDAADTDFPAEDPYIWCQDGRYYAVVKDMNGHFTGAGKSLAGFTSPDGLRWSPAPAPLVSPVQLRHADGSVQPLHALERPQVYLEHGRPAVLFCAADVNTHRDHSFNVHLPLGLPTT